ncbi:MAG TPA: DUF3108 domain-containing protein [Oleiagrimonas sp.]|nr:DUF3108 domain-containing protein [Oleiagrimonas sp.]
MKRYRTLLATLFCLLPLAVMAADTAKPAPLQPFTATYKVLRKGDPLGTSTLSLTRNADGTWTYRSSMQAEHGLAALLGGSIRESSHFRWHDGRIEALGYDYKMHLAIKDEQRHVKVDWQAGTVSVHTSDDGNFSYKPQPGLVERHVLVLALGRAVAAGKTDIALPVAVKDRVQVQTFAAQDKASVTVPAGTFQAVRVNRTHDDKGYSVWYAPTRFGSAPVKLFQQSGGDITLLLKTFKR